MLTLTAKIRQILGRKVKKLRKKGILPAVLYGSKLKEVLPLEVDLKEFEKVYQEAGESTLITLEIEGPEGPPTKVLVGGYGARKKEKSLVLIHEIEFDPLTDKLTHVDFYQPSLKEEVEVTVPLIFEGEAPAVKELGGTLVKNISEITVKALPQNLPHQIRVNIEKLKAFEDRFLIRDLEIPAGVKIMRNPEEIIAQVVPLEKVEEELEKPIEEKVEEVEKVKEKEGEKEGLEEKEETKEGETPEK